MQGITVNLQGEDINQMIAQAILDSTLGETVRSTVQDAIKNLGEKSSTSWYSPTRLEDHIRGLVHNKINELVATEYKEQVEALARNAIEERLTKDLVGQVIDNMLSGRNRY